MYFHMYLSLSRSIKIKSKNYKKKELDAAFNEKHVLVICRSICCNYYKEEEETKKTLLCTFLKLFVLIFEVKLTEDKVLKILKNVSKFSLFILTCIEKLLQTQFALDINYGLNKIHI